MQPLIDVDTLAVHLGDPRWVIFDCRHDLTAPSAGEALYRGGHIEGARFAHLDRNLSGAKTGHNGRHPLPTREAFADFLAAAGVDRDSIVVAYDATNGLYASRLWWLTRWIGHADVAVVDGGVAAWIAAGLPLTVAVPKAAPGSITVGPSLVRLVETADLEADLAPRTRLVIDARAPERYRGEVEPMDPVAGHIPHAVNHPMAYNLQADGRFKDAAALRSAFDTTLAGRSPETVVQSCGSGVTACHNLLAMERAGLPGAALYAGSWSAWSSDPARPIERGA
ncbi:MAG: sulfurtransferase [Burkholderiaceae bacterium]